MKLQQLANIAARYTTEMAKAMLRACVVKHYATGEPLDMPAQATAAARSEARPTEEPSEDEWRRMVEGNREARFLHG